MKCASGTAGAGTSPWPCWPRPFWRWLGIRRPRGDRVKRGLPRRGGRADTDDGARGAPIALPAGLDALPPGGFGVGLVSVETATSGQSPALSLSTPPQTSGIISATVVLRMRPLPDSVPDPDAQPYERYSTCVGVTQSKLPPKKKMSLFSRQRRGQRFPTARVPGGLPQL